MKRALILLIRGYRLFFSAWVGAGCRFHPTCSVYAIEALERHGSLAGSYLAARRLLRCHPWCEGGADPVPAAAPRLLRPGGPPGLFTRLVRAGSSSPSASHPASTSSNSESSP